MISHRLLVGTTVFPPSYVTEGSSAPFNCWNTTYPTSISYPMSVTFFDRLFQCFQLFQVSFLYSCFLMQVQRTLCAAEAHSTMKRCEENRLYKENISSFPSPLSILCASLRTHDSSVEKSWSVWPDKGKGICLRKSWVGKSSLAHGLMVITKSLLQKQKQHNFVFFC